MKSAFLYRFLLLGWLFLLTGTVAFAQKITLNGTVTDAKTAMPLEGVSVQLSVGKKVALTNAEGTFSLQIDTIFAGATLTFSHLSYQTLTLKIKSGQTSFSIKLQPKYNTISEVKITANKKLKPKKIRPETIVDYAITGNWLYILGREPNQKNPSLQVLALQTDSLLLSYRLPVYASELFVDCLENLHLLTEDKVYQVYYDSVSLQLYPPDPKSKFEQILRPCVAANNTNIYFQRNINKGIITSFYSVNRQSQGTKLLRIVQDTLVLRLQKDEANFQKSRLERESDPEAKHVNKERFGRSMARNAYFAQKVMFIAPYVPLLKVGENICLFDHASAKLEVYKNDSLWRTCPINYHLQKTFAREIIVDKPEQKAYALFQKNGLYELKLLNLETGETATSYHINNPFASKIRIHQGIVYFLYRDPTKNNRQFIFKAALSNF